MRGGFGHEEALPFSEESIPKDFSDGPKQESSIRKEELNQEFNDGKF